VRRTDADLRTYLTQFLWPEATNSDLDQLFALYPSDPSQGSPYDTGDQNALTPQYKRMASINGDLVFQATRRFVLDNVSGKQKCWSYCKLLCCTCSPLSRRVSSNRYSHVRSNIVSKRLKNLPFLGSVHGSDVPVLYGGGDLTNYLIQFVTNLDPNGGSSTPWPQYTPESRQLLTFYDAPTASNITLDDFRADAIAFLQNVSLRFPL